jgi:hypothetical protein
MQPTVQRPQLIGKRAAQTHSSSTKMNLAEKDRNPMDVQSKMRKKDKRKTIFSKSKQYCTCTGKKLCDKPRATK